MELQKVLTERKSVRKYENAPVAKQKIIEILKAGIQAPTGGNLQPWRFIVTRDHEKIKEVVRTTYVGANKNNKPQKWIEQVPLLIVVCLDYTETRVKYGEKGIRVARQDGAAAIENMLLRTVDLGLGGCWIAGFRQEELKEIFNIPPRIEVLAFLTVGKSLDDSKKRSKDSLNDVAFLEEYGQGSDFFAEEI